MKRNTKKRRNRYYVFLAIMLSLVMVCSCSSPASSQTGNADSKAEEITETKEETTEKTEAKEETAEKHLTPETNQAVSPVTRLSLVGFLVIVIKFVGAGVGAGVGGAVWAAFSGGCLIPLNTA